jgi:type IV pilus assembly protein PilV
MKQRSMRDTQGGALMIEVLVTIVIVVIGTLGLMQIQSRLQKSEMESYQRTQAVILLNDMATRISSNRANAASYDTRALTPAYMGGVAADLNCSTLLASPVTQLGNDAFQWCQALQGAGELQGGSSVGSMIGGRGCVEPHPVIADQYMVTVVWQGTAPISAPPTEITCGADLYDLAGTDCQGDLCRRYVSTIVRIARLDA